MPVDETTVIETRAYWVVVKRFVKVAVQVSTPPKLMCTACGSPGLVEFIWNLTPLERTMTVTFVEAGGTPGLLPVTVIVYVPDGVCPSIAAKVRVALAWVMGTDIVTHVGLIDGLSTFAPLGVRQTVPVKVSKPVTVIVDVPLPPSK